jgi:prepilin-type N-terminal cleavage/methylation domain-containing protein
MANDASEPTRRDRGFSLIELLIVVAIVAVMAAVALPNIGQYIRNYKIRGAAQDVAGELQTARSKAIMTNTNAGVSFVVVDHDSYRYVLEDLPTSNAQRLGPLRDLPGGVEFVLPGGTNAGPTLRFTRLGGFCNPAASGTSCGAAIPSSEAVGSADGSRIDSGSFGQPFVADDPALSGGVRVRLRELSTSLERTVRIAPGGRVLPQP